ncbi:hypothetical protein Y032_0396g685 [Ancylostoma ceylanicum]|uniref:Uncharacterized protein n=1 Tax=Ancylostoma ceylanicum TaxID=53326 RepID=A0A016RSL6_9BILA|nr:hypothetical protein Y032_0396g685 [Ancylostoma ceylanicum]
MNIASTATYTPGLTIHRLRNPSFRPTSTARCDSEKTRKEDESFVQFPSNGTELRYPFFFFVYCLNPEQHLSMFKALKENPEKTPSKPLCSATISTTCLLLCISLPKFGAYITFER